MIGRRLVEMDAGATSAIEMLQSNPELERWSQSMLELLARAASCQWGTYWIVDREALRIHPVATWSALGAITEALERDTRDCVFTLDEGNAGLVWRSGKPMWSTRLVLDMCLPRSLCATDAGLQAGMWFAVKDGAAVHGVIELLASALEPKSPERLRAIERIGLRLGVAFAEAHRGIAVSRVYPDEARGRRS
ncbi:MAG TPA: GAF domain-containing protein [Steroidobacteraceae bacterium]|nr:GAF domain-containing protein [Steroidobacteraceae bacterium]